MFSRILYRFNSCKDITLTLSIAELFEVLGTIELVLEDFKEARDAIASRLDEKMIKDLHLIACDIETSQSSPSQSVRYTNTEHQRTKRS